MRLIFLLAILFSMPLKAQDINSVFISMPDSLSPMLTKVNRQDFADFLSSGMKAVVKNKFGGDAEMLEMTDDFLRLKTTQSSVEEMKLLPLNDSVNVVCVVTTCAGPVEDSSVRFYTTGWEKLPTDKYISLPLMKDFCKDDASSPLVLKDMLLYKAQLSAESKDIKFEFRSLEATDKETSERFSSSVKKCLEYSWIDGRYEMKR